MHKVSLQIRYTGVLLTLSAFCLIVAGIPWLAVVHAIIGLSLICLSNTDRR